MIKTATIVFTAVVYVFIGTAIRDYLVTDGMRENRIALFAVTVTWPVFLTIKTARVIDSLEQRSGTELQPWTGSI